MQTTAVARLWPVVILTLSWFFLSLTPLPPNDLWWHMAAGRAMATEGALITTNRWAFTLPADAPYLYQSWLSELALYGAYQLGGVPALALLRQVAVVGGFGLVAWHAARRAGSPRAAALALLIAAMISLNNWTLRPQTLALLPGAAFLTVLGEWLDGRLRDRWLAALPALMVIWANAHGSFAIGVGLLGLAWLGVALQAGRGDAAAQQRLPAISLALAASSGATLSTPLGAGIIGYLDTMLNESSLQRWFIEWQPPQISFDPTSTGFWFFAVVLLLAVLLALGPRRPSAIDLLWYCAMAWLTFGGVRYAMWFALALLPLLADRIGLLMGGAPQPGEGAPQPDRATAASHISLALLGLVVILTLPWLTPARYLGNPAAFAVGSPQSWHLARSTPVAAVAWLQANPIAGRLFVEMSQSSYTMWGIPQTSHFADLRVELFPPAIWEQYFTIGNGKPEAPALLDRWQVTHVLINPDDQGALRALLKATPGWCEVYTDPTAAIIARC